MLDLCVHFKRAVTKEFSKIPIFDQTYLHFFRTPDYEDPFHSNWLKYSAKFLFSDLLVKEMCKFLVVFASTTVKT